MPISRTTSSVMSVPTPDARFGHAIHNPPSGSSARFSPGKRRAISTAGCGFGCKRYRDHDRSTEASRPRRGDPMACADARCARCRRGRESARRRTVIRATSYAAVQRRVHDVLALFEADGRLGRQSLEEPHRRAVLAHHDRRERPQPAARAQLAQAQQQLGAEPGALPRVLDHDPDLGLVGAGPALVLGDADHLVVGRHRDQRLPTVGGRRRRCGAASRHAAAGWARRTGGTRSRATAGRTSAAAGTRRSARSGGR